MQDTDLEREFQVHRTEKDYALAEFWKWAISCLIGLAMGCIGFSVDWGINLLNDAKYQSTANVLRTHGKHDELLIFCAIGICMLNVFFVLDNTHSVEVSNMTLTAGKPHLEGCTMY